MMSLLYRAADRIRRRRYPGNSGRIGEDLAHRHLRRSGCTVVARNYRPPTGAGEIDLIVWEGATLAFVEVKTRATGEFGAPDSAVDAEKRLRLVWAAMEYARRAGIPWTQTRFDIVSVLRDSNPIIEWQRDAFRSEPG
jgi:putative endonuclease